MASLKRSESARQRLGAGIRTNIPSTSQPDVSPRSSHGTTALKVGDFVGVSGTEKKGFIRFIGPVHFSSGAYMTSVVKIQMMCSVFCG
jgi:hypothetical protein